MLSNLRKSNNKGFTIIEVMIVLAIAGMIILVVLLAIPALQRNGRNTAIKTDASAIAGAIAEFASNNDGAVPTAAASDDATAGSVSVNNATGTAVIGKIQASTDYTDAQGVPAAAITPTAGVVTVVYGTKCPATVSGTSVMPVASPRSAAVIYATETSSAALQARCLET